MFMQVRVFGASDTDVTYINIMDITVVRKVRLQGMEYTQVVFNNGKEISILETADEIIATHMRVMEDAPVDYRVTYK